MFGLVLRLFSPDYELYGLCLAIQYPVSGHLSIKNPARERLHGI